MRDFVHLSKFENVLCSGAEWAVQSPLWVVFQLHRGVAYACADRVNDELVSGGIILIPPYSSLTVLASQLGEVGLRGFALRISSLLGLITAAERMCLEGELAQESAPFRKLPPTHPLAERMNQLFQGEPVTGLTERLALVQAFLEWSAPSLSQAGRKRREAARQNPRARLQTLLSQMPESELVNLKLEAVARQLCCCARHANRLFYELCGCSFRSYVTELRLNKACQMLLEGEHKIIDVAQDSGHRSLAQFNYAFKNRFRLSPSEWRDRHLARKARTTEPALLAVA